MFIAIAAASLAAFTFDGPDIIRDGAFAFPQKEAKVLCDTPDLKLSAWSDAEHLYVQAIIRGDGDATDGLTADGRKVGDNSNLIVDADANGATTANLDRSYTLNPWPSLPGLRYSTLLGGGASTGLQSDSKGRGAISYFALGGTGADGGRKVRVDSYLIPLAEINRKPGDKVRFAFYAHSTTPELTVNSVGFTSPKRYYSHSLPWKDFHDFTLAERAAALDIQQVPEGRATIALDKQSKQPMPATGAQPPDVTALAWLNWKGEQPPSLASLKGKVIAVEFWATWCGPCVAGIPHLNELHDKYAKDGLVILSLTDQAKKDYIEEFAKGKGMKYIVGVGSEAVNAYGVQGIPHAFLIGRDGTIAWNGYPADEVFEKKIVEELAKR
jgi:cytochrome c biogenesis protein CcmG/thiol:disulfide interchange protein DsbE